MPSGLVETTVTIPGVLLSCTRRRPRGHIPRSNTMAKVPAFHTDSTLYRPEDRLVYHDNDECGYGNRIKRDGNNIAGTAGRDRCERCDTLAG
jgi:hypothetical protein